MTQLVQVSTHSQFGVATKCLDHTYSTNPEKLSNVEASYKGMTDHELIKIQRFSKSLKNNPRYVRKRCFKNFDKHDFKLRVSKMPELVNIHQTSCANQAAEILTAGLTRELDSCAPVRTIQMRSKYAPHLQESTKHESLEPVLIEEYSENFEIIVADIKVAGKDIRIINAYGPQENWTSDEKMPFFVALEEEISKSQLDGKSIILELDANSKLGPKYIEKDLHPMSQNRVILSGIIDRRDNCGKWVIAEVYWSDHKEEEHSCSH